MIPRDGIPRISSEGLEMVERGLKGDFTGWVRSPANHPLSIPESMLSNLRICVDPDTMDFLAIPWYGKQFPKLDGLSMAPRIRFNGVDRQSYCIPPTPVCRFTLRDGSRPWEFMTDLAVGLDDLGLHQESYDDDDTRCCDIIRASSCKTTLDAFL